MEEMKIRVKMSMRGEEMEIDSMFFSYSQGTIIIIAYMLLSSTIKELSSKNLMTITDINFN